MRKRSEVVALYKPNKDEAFQVIVTAADAYPDGLRQARVEAVAGVHDLIADARKQYGEASAPDDAQQ